MNASSSVVVVRRAEPRPARARRSPRSDRRGTRPSSSGCAPEDHAAAASSCRCRCAPRIADPLAGSDRRGDRAEPERRPRARRRRSSRRRSRRCAPPRRTSAAAATPRVARRPPRAARSPSRCAPPCPASCSVWLILKSGCSCPLLVGLLLGLAQALRRPLPLALGPAEQVRLLVRVLLVPLARVLRGELALGEVRVPSAARTA